MDRFCSLCGNDDRTLAFKRGYICKRCHSMIRRINISALAAPGNPAVIDRPGSAPASRVMN